jgi:YHS domain-containing protein
VSPFRRKEKHLKKQIALIVALLTLCTSMAVASSKKSETPYLTRVDNKQVCMVNNGYMKKDQIPVPVEDRTYYGCCQMCVTALQSDKTKRVAIDPVSGKKVDKSLAVIGADADGNVFYFETADNLAKYKPAS